MHCIMLNCKRNAQVGIYSLVYWYVNVLKMIFKGIEFERESESRCNSDENCFSFLSSFFFTLFTIYQHSLPSKKVNSTQWPMFRSAREYMKACAFIIKFCIIQCTDL